MLRIVFFFFKQKTAYEMRISDWSSDVCSSDVVFQDPYGSLSPRMSIAQIVEEGLKVHGIGADAAERDALVMQALEEVDLDPDSRNRYPHEFPGGQRQRVADRKSTRLNSSH